MTLYLLDTNVISELRKPKPHGGAIEWLKQLRDEQIHISAVTMGELQRGIERIRHENRIKAQEIEAWVDRLASSAQILAMDTRCFREWARLMAGKQDYLLEDAMIAATARVHGFVVVTRNERDFVQFDVPVFNPFKARP